MGDLFPVSAPRDRLFWEHYDSNRMDLKVLYIMFWSNSHIK